MKYEGKKTCKAIMKAMEGGAILDAERADALGVSLSTFYEWKNKYPEFSEAIKRGKAKSAKPMANAIFELGKGYYVEETVAVQTFKVVKDKDGKSEKTVPVDGTIKKETRKRWVQSESAARYILENLSDGEFRDTRRIENTGHIEVETVTRRKKTTPKEFLKAALKIASDYGLTDEADVKNEGEEG